MDSIYGILVSIKLSQVGWLTLSAISSTALGNIFFLWSSTSIGVTRALAISSIFPIWTAALGWILRGEILTSTGTIALILLVFGVIIVIITGKKEPLNQHAWTSSPSKVYLGGIFLAFIASFFWAINSVAAAEGGRELSTSVSSVLRIGATLILCPIFSRIFTPKTRYMLPYVELKKVSLIFALEGFVGTYFFIYGLTHSSFAAGAALTSLAPVVAIPIEIYRRKDKLNYPRMLGIILIVAGVYFLIKPE
jgi:drug/metabolite transporter (DMT)-like permease